MGGGVALQAALALLLWTVPVAQEALFGLNGAVGALTTGVGRRPTDVLGPGGLYGRGAEPEPLATRLLAAQDW